MNQLAPTVSVIIPNWNGKQHLDDCLSSVLDQTFESIEIILVDNGSTDRSVEFVRERFPSVRIIRNNKNLGFAGGTNVGIRASQAEYIITLNNDTIVAPNWVEELLKIVPFHEEVGLCQSKLIKLHEPGIIDGIGIAMRSNGAPRAIGHGEQDKGQHERVMEVFGASAGAALYKREMLNDIGLFDEDFFAFGEDIDLSWRARLRGWKCLSVPKSLVYHKIGGTVSEGTPLRVYFASRNTVYYIVKNFPRRTLRKLLPGIMYSEFWKAPYFHLKKKEYHLVRALISGKVDALKNMQILLKKRKSIQGQCLVDVSSIDVWFENEMLEFPKN